MAAQFGGCHMSLVVARQSPIRQATVEKMGSLRLTVAVSERPLPGTRRAICDHVCRSIRGSDRADPRPASAQATRSSMQHAVNQATTWISYEFQLTRFRLIVTP